MLTMYKWSIVRNIVISIIIALLLAAVYMIFFGVENVIKSRPILMRTTVLIIGMTISCIIYYNLFKKKLFFTVMMAVVISLSYFPFSGFLIGEYDSLLGNYYMQTGSHTLLGFYEYSKSYGNYYALSKIMEKENRHFYSATLIENSKEKIEESNNSRYQLFFSSYGDYYVVDWQEIILSDKFNHEYHGVSFTDFINEKLALMFLPKMYGMTRPDEFGFGIITENEDIDSKLKNEQYFVTFSISLGMHGILSIDITNVEIFDSKD